MFIFNNPKWIQKWALSEVGSEIRCNDELCTRRAPRESPSLNSRAVFWVTICLPANNPSLSLGQIITQETAFYILTLASYLNYRCFVTWTLYVRWYFEIVNLFYRGFQLAMYYKSARCDSQWCIGFRYKGSGGKKKKQKIAHPFNRKPLVDFFLMYLTFHCICRS